MTQDQPADYLTEAIEAVRDALYRGEGKDLPAGLAEVAVHVAAPIIERAVRERFMPEIGTTNSASFVDEHGNQGEVRGHPSIVEQVARLIREHGPKTTTTAIPRPGRGGA